MLESKTFYRRMEAMLDGMAGNASPRRFGRQVLPRLVEQFGDSLGLRQAQLYERRNGEARLVDAGPGAGLDLSSELSERLSLSGSDGIAELPWSGRTGGGWTGLFGFPESSAFVVALLFDDANAAAFDVAHVQSIVSPLHYAVNQHLRRREFENLIEQARAIQVSLLPGEPPSFGDFDIAAASVPAHVVAGDFYDFLAVDADTLGLVVADASGHGLPAALQARDVATGLRMGVERDLKITRTVEKLNRVIHRSGLASRFISMIFGELEHNGNLSYINAGHSPALLLDDRGLHELTVGGTVLGPRPDATYKLGFAHLDRGAALALYTDGVTERGIHGGEAFGTERLAAWPERWREGPSAEAVADLLEQLRNYAGGRPFEDDVTIVLVRRSREKGRAMEVQAPDSPESGDA